jgi:hypothetical protein
MQRIIVESPLNAPTREGVEENKAYARACVLDSLRRGEVPYASHVFFDQPGLLDDLRPGERRLGMEAGLAWGEVADLVAAYLDRGVSNGMRAGIALAKTRKQAIHFRSILGMTGEEIRQKAEGL